MACYQREEVIKTNQLERDVNGLIQNDSRKKKYKDRSAIIEQYSILLRNEKIGVVRFLNTMSNMDNKIAFEDHEFPELNPDSLGFEFNEDLGIFTEITSNDSNNIDPIVVKTSAVASVPIVVLKRQRAKKTTTSVEKQPVLTRSKSRKMLMLNGPSDSNAIDSNVKRRATEAELDSPQDMVHGRPKRFAPIDNLPAETELETGIAMTKSKARNKSDTQQSIGAVSFQLDKTQENELETVSAITRSKTRNASNIQQSIEAVSSQLENAVQNVTLDRVIDSEVSRLNKKFEEIVTGSATVTVSTSNLCMMACARPKATVLLPCKHQPICNQCFVLWKLFLSKERKNIYCPACKLEITSHIAVN